MNFLRGFAGIIQTDGYVCYELIAGDSSGRILPATCWAHARRKFNDVLQLGDNRHARRALTAMRQLYDIEDRARLFNDTDRLALRQAESKPIVTELFDWMTPLLDQTLPKSKLRLALQVHASPPRLVRAISRPTLLCRSITTAPRESCAARW